MARIDVTDVLLDPDFQETISVAQGIRALVNGKGADTYAGPIPLNAVVTPVPIRLIQQSDGSLRDGAIWIYTVSPMSGGAKMGDSHERLPDLVTWHGRQYLVASVEDWTSWGAGFQRVTANLRQLNPAA